MSEIIRNSELCDLDLEQVVAGRGCKKQQAAAAEEPAEEPCAGPSCGAPPCAGGAC